MRMRKKPNLIPRMEACSDIWIREPESRRGRWKELYPEAREVRLEVGWSRTSCSWPWSGSRRPWSWPWKR